MEANHSWCHSRKENDKYSVYIYRYIFPIYIPYICFIYTVYILCVCVCVRPAAERLGCAGRDAQVVQEAVFERAARVVLALLPRHLASGLDKKQDNRINKTTSNICEL